MARPTWTLTGPLSAPHGAVLAGTEITLSLVPGVSRDPSGSDLRAGSTVAVVGADGTLTVKGTGDPVMLLASSPDAPVHYRLSCIPRVLPTVTFTAPEGGSLALDDIVPEVPAPIPPVDASTLRAEWQAALVTDHGALTGLNDDDHPQYALADGTRGAFAAPLGADDNYVTDAEKAALHGHSNKAALDLVSGTNTGDQVLPTWATISGKPAVIGAGATAADARTAIGAGTSSFSGAYADLTGKPTLGTAADNAETDFATAAQGAKADTALQPSTAQAINAQTGTSYTLQASDAGKLVTLDNTGAITLNAPGSVFTAGQRVDVLVLNTGMATVVGTSGATANGTPSLVSRARYSAFTVLWLSATSAVVVGDLA